MGIHEIRRSRQAQKRLKAEYADLFAAMSRLLFDCDPVGIAAESNLDEYEPEVATILPRLRECRCEDDVRRILHEEFTRWFNADTAGPPSAHADLARRIWAMWCERVRPYGTPPPI